MLTKDVKICKHDWLKTSSYQGPFVALVADKDAVRLNR